MIVNVALRRETFGIVKVEVPDNWLTSYTSREITGEQFESLKQFIASIVEATDLNPFTTNFKECPAEIVGIRENGAYNVLPDISLLPVALRAEAV